MIKHQIKSRRMAVLAAISLCLSAGIAAAQSEAAQTFREACAGKAAAAGDAMAVAGSDGWWFLANELRHLGVGQFWGDRAAAVSRATNPREADPLPAILDFKRQLDGLGIELILAPVPPKAVIYPDKLAAPADGKTPQRLDGFHQEFYKLLREKGVNVLDLTDELLASRAGDDGPVFCRQDTHWSGVACNLAAKRIAGLLRQKDWCKDVKRVEYGQKTALVEIAGDLWNALDEKSRPARETLKLRVISSAAGTPVAPDKNSPVILLGDSHNLVFQAGGDMHAAGAGLADQLAFELGFAVDLVAVRGSGATPARINLYRCGRAEPDYFANKKVIVWCFSAREFTESPGWRSVPVTK